MQPALAKPVEGAAGVGGGGGLAHEQRICAILAGRVVGRPNSSKRIGAPPASQRVTSARKGSSWSSVGAGRPVGVDRIAVHRHDVAPPRGLGGADPAILLEILHVDADRDRPPRIATPERGRSCARATPRRPRVRVERCSSSSRCRDPRPRRRDGRRARAAVAVASRSCAATILGVARTSCGVRRPARARSSRDDAKATVAVWPRPSPTLGIQLTPLMCPTKSVTTSVDAGLDRGVGGVDEPAENRGVDGRRQSAGRPPSARRPGRCRTRRSPPARSRGG